MIVCEAKQNREMKQADISGGSIYLSHHGYVTPCCWQGTLLSLKTIWKESGLDPKLHNINHYSIQEILDGPVFKWIEDQWTATNSTETKKYVKRNVNADSMINLNHNINYDTQKLLIYP